VSLPNLFDDAAKARLRALYGARPVRDDAWHARRLRHARECLAVADRMHTSEELAAARAALEVDPKHPQKTLFNAPPHAGVATSGQPEPCGLAGASIQGSGGHMRIFETVGAIDVEAAPGGVMVTQHDICGGEASVIYIPQTLIGMVCKAILKTSNEDAEI